MKNDRSIRGNRRGRAANICDRSGSSVNEWFAGWKASPSCWKDAGEAEWWRHGRCGQVARKDAAGRSPVHPFAPSRPPRRRLPPSLPIAIRTCQYSRIHRHVSNICILIADLSFSLLSCRPSPILSSFCVSRCFPPFPYVESSPL